MMHGLPEWFETSLGRFVRQREASYLFPGVRRCHGDLMLWLGHVAMTELALERCMIRHRVLGSLAGRSDAAGTEQVPVMEGASRYLGRVEALPFRTSSVDAVVVHHGLDRAEDPRSAIREIGRVIRPGGWLLICGFNPHSLFGLRALAGRLGNGVFGSLRLLSPLRLLDWLAVLGFETDEGINYMVYRLPIDTDDGAHPRWRRLANTLERWRVPTGGVYTIMARKAGIGMTPRQGLESAAARPKFSPVPMPKPTTRNARNVR